MTYVFECLLDLLELNSLLFNALQRFFMYFEWLENVWIWRSNRPHKIFFQLFYRQSMGLRV